MGEKLFIYRYKNKSPGIREKKSGALKWTFLSIILFFIVLALLPIFKKKKEPEKSKVIFDLPGKNVLIKKVPLPATMSSAPKSKKTATTSRPAITTPREKKLNELYGKKKKLSASEPVKKTSVAKLKDKQATTGQVFQTHKSSAKKEELVYVVQVGAFKKEKNALLLMDKLKKKGYRVFLTARKHGDLGVMYHVALDPVKKRSEALQLKEKLIKEEGIGGAYIKKEKR